MEWQWNGCLPGGYSNSFGKVWRLGKCKFFSAQTDLFRSSKKLESLSKISGYREYHNTSVHRARRARKFCNGHGHRNKKSMDKKNPENERARIQRSGDNPYTKTTCNENKKTNSNTATKNKTSELPTTYRSGGLCIGLRNYGYNPCNMDYQPVSSVPYSIGTCTSQIAILKNILFAI